MTAGWCPRCEACGAFSCNGIDCYLADSAIPEDEVCLCGEPLKDELCAHCDTPEKVAERRLQYQVERELRFTMGAPASAEQWRPVVGYEGRYEISDQGRVRSFVARGGKEFLTPDLFKDGYLRIAFNKNGKRTSYLLHRVVAEAFHGEQRNELHNEVAHLDGSRRNCVASNLKWVSRVENCSHKIAHGTFQVGENHPSAKLTVAAVRRIRTRYAPSKTIAADYGVSRHTIFDIWQNKRWINA